MKRLICAVGLVLAAVFLVKPEPILSQAATTICLGLPALIGDVTSSAGTCAISVGKILGVTINSVPSSGNLVGTTDSQTLSNKIFSSLNLTALSASAPVYTDGSKNLTSTAPTGYSAVLSGTSSSIGGGALIAGACTSGTVTVTGATTSMAVTVTPTGYPGDAIYWKGYVSSSNTVTVDVCAAIAATPTAETYNVRVLQ